MMRPPDGDALRAALREVVDGSGMPVVFGGRVGDVTSTPTIAITELFGARTRHLRGLRVQAGSGLGGRVLAEYRVLGVEDYGVARGISHDYDVQVLAEGLRTVVAAPVLVGGRPRAVLYAGSRVRGSIGDRVRGSLVAAASRMAVELAVRDEVDRRLVMLEAASVSGRSDLHDLAQLEKVREVHADLRVLAQEVTDADLQARVHDACRRLASLGLAGTGAPAVRLSARETDVLAQVALGCSNIETGRRLSVGAETVKSYLGSAMSKLDARSRHAAVVRARTLGLLP